MWSVVASLCCLIGVSSGTNIVLDAGKPSDVVLWTNESVQLSIYSIPAIKTHLTVQVHSQWQNVTLEQIYPPKSDNKVTGNHVGLVMLLKTYQSSAIWKLETNSSEISTVTCTLLVTLHDHDDPIPGGCNLESPLENDPNIYSPRYDFQNHLQFSWPNKGPVDRGSPEKCGDPKVTKSLEMDLYLMWMPERAMSADVYNYSLHKMLSVRDIEKYGTKVKEISLENDKTRQSFSAYPRQGVIYNVVVCQSNAQAPPSCAAHVPLVTYSCEYTSGKCSSYSIGLVVMTHFLALLGLVLCFAGHRLFYFEMFAVGALMTQLVCYILLFRFTALSETNCVYISLAPAVAGGLLWLFFWLGVGVPVLSVLMAGLLMGFVVSSVVFSYTPFGNFEWWQSGLNYGMGFLCGVLLPVVLFLYSPRTLNIVSCSVVGSYYFVLMVDTWAQGSIKWALVNSIHKAAVPNFWKTDDSVPYQISDFILLAIWVVLAAAAVIVQLVRERGREKFPRHPWLKLRREESELRFRVHQAVDRPARQIQDEARPLLQDNEQPNYQSNTRQQDQLMQSPDQHAEA